MAVRRRIGEALSGFAESFLPAWQQQQYMERLARSEDRAEDREKRLARRQDIMDVTGMFEKEGATYPTPWDYETFTGGVEEQYSDLSPEEIGRMSATAFPTDVERVRQVRANIGPTFADVGTERLLRELEQVGARPIPGLTPGMVGPVYPPEVAQEPHLAGLEALQASERGAEEVATTRAIDTELRLEDERARQNERLAAEFHDATVTRAVDGQVALWKAGVPFEEDSLDRATEAAYEDAVKRARSGGELFEAALSRQRALTAINARFGKPSYAVIRNDAGELESAKVEWVPGVLPDSGRYEVVGLGEYLGDEFHPHMMNSMNWLRELLPANLMAQVEASVGLDSPMDTATPPGPPADVGGELPPVSPEVLADTEQKFYGPAVEDQQPAVSSLPIDEMQRILAGTDTSVMGTREVGPGLSGLTINLDGIRERLFRGTPPRALQAFLRQEGVVDWLSNQAVSDPQITHEMIQALLRTQEGLELLKNAWDTR